MDTPDTTRTTDTAPTRARSLPVVMRLLLVALAALLVVGVAPQPTAAARVDANAELKVARDAYDVILQDLWKEPDTQAMLTAAYEAAQKTLKVTGQPLKLSGSTNTQWNTFADGVRGLVRQANADLPENTLRSTMIRAMTETINDEHTYYMSAQMYDRRRAESRGDLSIVNYGFQRINVGDGVYMRSVVPGGNMERAGARALDQILAFDGKPVTVDNANEIFANPKEGSMHTFTVRRAEEAQPVDLQVTVRKYDRTTVTSRIIDGHIGYISINQFLNETVDRLDATLADFSKQGVDALIIDVRGNPGGLAVALSRAVGRFVPNGTVIGKNEGRGSRPINSLARSEGKTPSTLPLVILIDEGSGSASEYLALAARDFLPDATLVGTKTAGALGVASASRLSDGSAVEITLAVYTTAKGEQLNGVGITPDVEIAAPTNEQIIAGQDPQLAQAIAQANVKVGRQETGHVSLPRTLPVALAPAA